MISKEKIEQMAGLAKLKISKDEINEFSNKFSQVLEYIDKLHEVNTDNIEPLYQVYDYKQVLREDTVEEGLSREEVLQNTVEKQYGYFKLLNIMD